MRGCVRACWKGAIVLALLFPVSLIADGESLRETGDSVSCFLYCYGKGPFGLTELSIEFRRDLLNKKQPYVDDTKTASPEALQWIDRRVEPEVIDELRAQGRRLIRVEYTDPKRSSHGRPNIVMVALETERDSGWYRPIFVASPEIFRGTVISGSDIPLGYIATLEWSGTGAQRLHVAFDLSGHQPKPVRRLSSGRIVRNEFDSDEAYRAALPLWDEEADLFAGILWEEDKSFGDALEPSQTDSEP